MTANVTFVSNGDDWEGIYVNGICVEQEHYINTLNLMYILDKLGLIHFNYLECSHNWLNDQGALPERLDAVVFDE